MHVCKAISLQLILNFCGEGEEEGRCGTSRREKVVFAFTPNACAELQGLRGARDEQYSEGKQK